MTEYILQRPASFNFDLKAKIGGLIGADGVTIAKVNYQDRAYHVELRPVHRNSMPGERRTAACLDGLETSYGTLAELREAFRAHYATEYPNPLTPKEVEETPLRASSLTSWDGGPNIPVQGGLLVHQPPGDTMGRWTLHPATEAGYTRHESAWIYRDSLGYVGKTITGLTYCDEPGQTLEEVAEATLRLTVRDMTSAFLAEGD